ncbi:MAG TPA: class I SAM-dependent methyltransferase [Thermoclostridium caenicola]|nr:class I SAM-dependent methyltransferase [Thermoclostridium caenicola]
MELKGRLRLIYDMIPPCDTLCDIGTDHALVPAFALLNKRCRCAIATDIREGPLERARRTLDAYNLQDAMELRLGNGLEPISEDETDVIVLAGMGGVLITELLEARIEQVKKAKRIILQPMYAQEVVRPFLWQHGFAVVDEALIQEGSKLYQVLAVCHDAKASARARKDPVYATVGEGLIRKRDPLLKAWLCDRMRRQRKIVDGLKKAACPAPNLEQEENLLKDMERLYGSLFGK